VHDVAGLSTEDAVKLVFSAHSIAAIASLAETMKFSPIVPAPRFLAEIASQSPLVAELGACHLGGALSQARIEAIDQRAFRHLRDGGEGTDADSAVGRFRDASQLLDPADAHDLFRAKDTIAKTA
jgi:hypothetical protein